MKDTFTYSGEKIQKIYQALCDKDLHLAQMRRERAALKERINLRMSALWRKAQKECDEELRREFMQRMKKMGAPVQAHEARPRRLLSETFPT